MSTSIEGIQERLDAARAELEGLLQEQRQLPRQLDRARREDHETRMQAAREGGSVASAVKGIISNVRGVKDRAEELPYLIWSARLRVLELEVEHRTALAPGLEEQFLRAREESHAADRALEEARKRARDLSDAYSVAMHEHEENHAERRRVEQEIARLNAAGPELPASA